MADAPTGAVAGIAFYAHFVTSMSAPVLIRFGALGDTLMLTPVFRYLARHFDTAVDFAGRGPWSRALLQGQPAVGSISELHSKRLPYSLSQDKRVMARWLGDRRHGVFFDIEGDATSAELLARAGIPLARVKRLRDFSSDPRYHHQVHTTLSRVRRSIEGRGDIDDLDTALRLSVLPAWRADIDDWLGERGWGADDLIVIAPGNKRTMSLRPYGRESNRKHWEIAHWARLCRWLLQVYPRARVLVVGAPVEQRLAVDVARAAGSGRVCAVACDMTVPRLFALLERAIGAIVLDSGPSHAAAAVGCPVVTLFKATDPMRFAPLSASGHTRLVTPGDVAPEDWRPGKIEPGSVFRAWRELQESVCREAGEQGRWLEASVSL